MCKKEVIQVGNAILREMTEMQPKTDGKLRQHIMFTCECTEKAVTFTEGYLQDKLPHSGSSI